jgi:hypothetical protein
MAAKYINGNSFSVVFMLWPRDLAAIFRHTYVMHPASSLARPMFGPFFRNAAIAAGVSLVVSLLAERLSAMFPLFYPVYFLGFLMALSYISYRTYMKEAEETMQKPVEITLNRNEIVFQDVENGATAIMRREDVEEIVDSRDAIFLRSMGRDFIVPKRVLTPDQKESLLCFK